MENFYQGEFYIEVFRVLEALQQVKKTDRLCPKGGVSQTGKSAKKRKKM